MDDATISLAAREAATSWDWAELIQNGGHEAVEQVVEDLVRDALREHTGGPLGEVAAERERQNQKWGEQNHLDGTGQHVVWAFTGPAEWVRQQATDDTDQAADEGGCTWRHILLEEVAEAFAEERPEELRAELVQIAAVATAWVEALDRRAKV